MENDTHDDYGGLKTCEEHSDKEKITSNIIAAIENVMGQNVANKKKSVKIMQQNTSKNGEPLTYKKTHDVIVKLEKFYAYATKKGEVKTKMVFEGNTDSS